MLHDVTCQKPESSLTIVRMTCTAVRSGPKGPCTALALAAFSCRYTRLAPTVPGEWALQPLFSWSYRLTHSVYSIEVLLYIIWTSMIWWCIHTTSYKIIQIFLHLVTYKYIYIIIYICTNIHRLNMTESWTYFVYESCSAADSTALNLKSLPCWPVAKMASTLGLEYEKDFLGANGSML